MITLFDFHIEKYDKHCYLCIETCPFKEAGQETYQTERTTIDIRQHYHPVYKAEVLVVS